MVEFGTGRRRLLAVASIVSVALLGVGVWLGLRGYAAQRHLTEARTQIAVARQALLERDVETASRAVQVAGVDTAHARRLTNDLVWHAAASVPGLGATPAAVQDLVAAADDVARSVLPQALDAAVLLDPERLRGPDGAFDLALLGEASSPLIASASSADAVRKRLDVGDGSVVPVVAERTDELRAQMDELFGVLSGAATGVRIAPVLLGEDRARRYLVVVQQTGESRGTGGLIGGFVALEASGGRIQVLDQGSNADLRNGPVPVPAGVSQEFVDLYTQFDAFNLWQNANVSPDLPMVSRVLRARWEAQGGQPLDGVIALDAVALAEILRGSGPVAVAGGRQIAPEEIPQYLAVDQYADFAPSEADVGLDRSRARKDALEDVAAAAAGRLAAGGGDTLSLVRGLATALQAGHLRMASDDPVLAPELAAAGIDGALPDGKTPLVYPVVVNATTGKLDHFLQRTVTYGGGSCAQDRRTTSVVVALRNDLPAEPLPPYLTTRVLGGERVDSRTNAVGLTVYVTPGTDLVRATVDGAPVAPEDPDGLLLINGEERGLPFYSLSHLELPPGETRTLTLELEEPVKEGRPVVVEQPLSQPLDARVTLPECGT